MTEHTTTTRQHATRTRNKAGETFTTEERAAMRERAAEQKTGRASGADAEQQVLEKIAEMASPDRAIAEQLHDLIREAAPELSPRTWYGMPAYAKDGKVVCYFQSAGKFKARYATLGFSDKANLDSGVTWPTSFALKELTPAAAKQIRALVKAALS